MLQAIRDKAQGWIAWAIVILISIPFALFGIQEYLGVDSNPPVAMVNGDEITTEQLEQRVRDVRENMRRALGDAFTPDLFEDTLIKPQVLQQMVDETLLRQEAENWNMRISDEYVAAYIRALPNLQNGGRFDPGLYEATVRSQGFSKAGFEALVRSDLGSRQQEDALKQTVLAPESYVDAQIRLAAEKRTLRFARIPAADYLDPSKVSETEAKSHYVEHARDYIQPERAKLAYVRLAAKDLMNQVEVDEADLREYFDVHRAELLANQERRVRHILIESGPDDDQEKRAVAEDILLQLRNGRDFAEMAVQYSNDPGSAEDGGDLGWVNRGVMVEPFEDAVFAAAKDELVGPVKTEYGYHIILVTDIRGGEEASFEQVRGQVDKAYRRAQAEELYYDYLERLADLSYETPDSLVPTAEALGLQVVETDWVTRSDRIPQLDSPKVMNLVFTDEAVRQGNNSDVIELGVTEAAVVRIREYQEESVQPFEDVREQVLQDAAQALASQKARIEGENHLSTLKGEKTLTELSATQGWEAPEYTVSRDARDVPAEILEAAFLIPSEGFPGRAASGVVSAEGDYFLVEVTAIEPGDPSSMDAGARQQMTASVSDAIAELEFRGVLQALRARADIEILLD